MEMVMWAYILLVAVVILLFFFASVWIMMSAWRTWKRYEGLRREAQRMLMDNYQIVVPDCLVISWRCNTAERIKVRKMANPVLRERAIIVHQRYMEWGELDSRKERGQKVKIMDLKQARESLWVVELALHHLWYSLYLCGIYSHQREREPTYQQILDSLKVRDHADDSFRLF